MSKTNEDIGIEFYNAFASKDLESMDKLYHPNLKFSDPAFGKLNREQALSMWKMLFTASQDLDVTFKVVASSEQNVRMEWLAKYSFGKNKRPIINRINADLEISDGLILIHTDSFNLHQWAKQALGFSGLLLGWTGYFKNKLQQQTSRRLINFMDSED